jgi:DNA polymerase-3 subunit alpha
MGKKIRSEMEKQRERFIEGAAGNGINRGHADDIFELLAKFADYGFNKSHAAAYALVAYQTAYMKAHYPVEFLAASMTLDMSNTDKLSEFRAEALRLGIKIDPPSVNRSWGEFEVSDNTIHYALAALKGVGAQAVEMIVEARGKNPFTGISDFATRVNPRAINKRVVESLGAAGAFDEFENNRARVFGGADRILGEANRAHESAVVGQNELFGGITTDGAGLMLPALEAWLPAERLQREYDAIGFFLSGHPLDDYAATLKRLKTQSWSEFCRAIRTGTSAGRVAATVISRMERRTKTGNKMGIIGLSDPTGQFEAVLFSEGLAQFRDMLEPGRAVLLQLGAELQGDDVRARIHGVEALDEAAAKTQMGLRIFLRDEKPLESIAKRLESVAIKSAGGASNKSVSDVTLIMPIDIATEVELSLPGRFKISPQIAGAIKAVPGVTTVELV